ncbi:MAG: glycogen debranching enzyme GlgX, partial [Betaproteobacteria bacterium]|nr:glycogen debranching enzyme GlgX [Betaproteobacteria bacterium]
ADLVSYEHKHNEANLEDGRDGHNNNLSWNGGVEGPTEDTVIRRLRQRRKRSLLATLFLSQGVPMILAGDEIGRTQLGNNNAYCQDNELSWLNWDFGEEERGLLEFVQRLIALRRAHPVFRRRDFYHGRPRPKGEAKDIIWFKPDGGEMTEKEWNQHFARSLGVFLSGDALSETDERGRPVRDRSALVLFNAHHEPISFVLPGHGACKWRGVLDTASDDGLSAKAMLDPGSEYRLQGRSLALLLEMRSEHG